MLIELNGKQFRLTKFPPIVGRRLMTKGVGVNGIFSRDVATWLPILEFVSVGLGQDQWIPLSTVTMLNNHVPESMQAELLTAILQFNCSEIDGLVSGPTIGDALWAEVYDAVAEAFKQ